MTAPDNHVFYRSNQWYYPKLTHGKGIYLFSQDKTYIDGCSGSAVANIGHGNERIAQVAKNQIETLGYSHLSRWTNDPIERCAEKIARLTPDHLNKVYFVSGGSEATEAAIKLARQYYVEHDQKSKWKIISKNNSFHGNTLGALSMTGIIERRTIYDPMLISFPKIPQFYHYRNPWQAETLYETSKKAAQALENEILFHGQDQIAAFITEVVVGSAAPGVHPDQIYFDMVQDICKRYNILLIVDEVMTGFGRTGKMFAIDHYDIKPDILCLAKGMSAGYTPIGAVVTSDEIYNTIMVKGTKHFKHGHTYGGNPLSAAIASEVIDILIEENLTDHANELGKTFLLQLQALYKYPIVGDIRGKGLMFGIEFCNKDKTPFDSSINLKQLVMQACFDQGLIIYPGGGSAAGKGDHILIAPPLIIQKDQLDDLYKKLDLAIQSITTTIGGYHG